MGEGATDQQKQELFEKIYESISQRIPTTNMEKFDAWRRIAMLTNPKPHIRNIAGNTLMAGVKRTADTIATGFEKLIPKSKRTKAVFVDKELKQIASDYFDANAKQLTEGSRWEVFGVKSPFADKRIFDNEVLEWINNFSKDTLEKEDIFFLKRHFQRDLAGFMQARGLKKPTQEAVDYALRRAQEATFREANDFATALNKLKGNKSFGKLVDAAMAFTKTPANILKTGLDYSPQGVVNAIFKITKGAEPQEVIEILSKGLTGTGIALAGYYLGKNGIIRGDYRGAKEESLLQRAGVLPNSLILPNGSYTIDWAQPAAIPLFMGVAFAEELNQAQQKADATDENIDYIDAYTNALFQSGETLINQSMLRGISELFGGFGTTTEKLAGLPIAYLEQGIPTILGQIARTTDPNKRQRDYSNVVDKAVTSTISKIPIYSKSLPKKFDLLGAEQVYGEGLANAFQQFLSPGYVGTDKGDRLTKELLRLYNEVGSDFLPRVNVKDVTYNGVTYEFAPEEVADFQKTIGKLTSDALNQLFKRNDYLRANDEEKAKMISKVDSNSYYKAKQDYLKEIGVLK